MRTCMLITMELSCLPIRLPLRMLPRTRSKMFWRSKEGRKVVRQQDSTIPTNIISRMRCAYWNTAMLTGVMRSTANRVRCTCSTNQIQFDWSDEVHCKPREVHLQHKTNSV